MREIETDYLVVGAGASGIAFADTLVARTDAEVVLVDRRHRPGGHWLDAYPCLAAYFDFALPPADLYSWIYAAGTYQNKPHRPGQYNFWLAHGLDTTNLPNGAYTLEVIASDTRNNLGTATVGLTISNTTG